MKWKLINVSGHMTKMAAMPIYGKIIEKKPSEPMDWLPWNLVCSIGVLGPIVVYSNDDWLDLNPIYIKVKFGHIYFCMGKSGNCYFFWKLMLPVNFNFVFAIN